MSGLGNKIIKVLESKGRSMTASELADATGSTHLKINRFLNKSGKRWGISSMAVRGYFIDSKRKSACR